MEPINNKLNHSNVVENECFLNLRRWNWIPYITGSKLWMASVLK